jgi:hypothetical protein
MLASASTLLADNPFTAHTTETKTAVAAFIVGTIVGITGMGGGALMTPALIFLGVGDASSVVTADLTSSAVYKSAGAAVHWRGGSPNLRLAGWLILGSVPFAFIGPHIVHWVAPDSDVDTTLKRFIGLALLLAASTYAGRLTIQLHRVTRSAVGKVEESKIRPLPTVLIGAVGGLLVGITSVGSGSVIMIALLVLYPTLSAHKLVGTDLVQAVPLVCSAAISNIMTNGLDWSILIPLLIGSVPGCVLGSKVAPRVPASAIRRGIVVVLTISGLALLDKAGWWPLGYHNGATSHPLSIIAVGLVMLVVLPLIWGALRRREGLPMFGKPAFADIEAPAGTPAARRAARTARKAVAERHARETSGEGGNGSAPATEQPTGRPAVKKAAARRRRAAAAKAQAAAGSAGSAEITPEISTPDIQPVNSGALETAVRETNKEGWPYDGRADEPTHVDAETETLGSEEPRPVG